MAKKKETRKRSDIRDFLVVLLSGVVAACVLVGVMVYFYSPSGRYHSHKVLLAPEVLASMVYSEPQGGGLPPARHVFQDVDFRYFDKLASRWKTVKVEPEVYQRFWDLIEGDWSLVTADETVAAHFRHPHPARLTVWVRPDPANGPVKAFQETYFVPDSDLYRVELKGTTAASGEWAYFYHPAIYEKVLSLFTASQQ